MDLICHVPLHPLSQWVEMIWHCQSEPVPFSLERLMPTGRVDLIINLKEDPLCVYAPEDVTKVELYRGPLLSGVQGTYSVIDASQQTLVMGVAFRPGGASVLPGLAVADIFGTHLDVNALWGTEVPLLWEMLENQPDPHSRIRCLEASLIQRIMRRNPPELHPAVKMALQEFSAHSTSARIRDMADWGGLSSRRFIELFTRQVGITPKHYGRIQRFQHTLKQIHQRRRLDWCELAFDSGYCDQSHLIRDFQQFCGMSPVLYQKHCTGHRNHVAMG